MPQQARSTFDQVKFEEGDSSGCKQPRRVEFGRRVRMVEREEGREAIWEKFVQEDVGIIMKAELGH